MFVYIPRNVELLSNGKKCDMLIGSCSCGIWHDKDDLEIRLEHLSDVHKKSCYDKIKEINDIKWRD